MAKSTGQETGIVIEGLVASTGGVDGRKGWILVVELAPWRAPGGRVETTPLRVELLVGDDRALDRWMEKLGVGDAVLVDAAGIRRARGAQDRTAKAVSRIRKTARDLGLHEARARREAPVVVDDPVLGTFTFDVRHDAFSGNRAAGGASYRLTIEVESSEPAGEGGATEIAAARKTVLAVEARLAEVLAAVTTSHLKAYNETWREGRPVLSAPDFASRLRVSSITCSSGGTTVWIDTGDLFGRHAFEVTLGARGAIRSMRLAG